MIRGPRSLAHTDLPPPLVVEQERGTSEDYRPTAALFSLSLDVLVRVGNHQHTQTNEQQSNNSPYRNARRKAGWCRLYTLLSRRNRELRSLSTCGVVGVRQQAWNVALAFFKILR